MAAEVQTLRDAEDASVLTAVEDAVGNLPEDPYERAQERLQRLRSSFASSLAIVAEMYRDEDWKYLSREDGTEYNTLAEVVSDVMQVSLSMARRYVQGGRDFYLPLSEVTVDGTRIEITSGDVAALGSDGLADAVDTARARLDGVDDPEEAEGIINDSLREARERKTGKTPKDHDPSEFVEDDFEGFDPPGRGGGYDGPAPGLGHTAAEDADWNDDGGDFSGLPAADPGEWDDESGDWAPSGASRPSDDVILDDPVVRVLDGSDDYSDPDKLADLPEPLRSVAAALVTLADMDTDDVAKMVTYDTRGVLVPVSKALGNATRFRALVETRPWYVSRLSS